MDFKDPLFSVILFFFLILTGILLARAFEKLRNILRKKEIENLIENFEYIDIDELKKPYNSLLLLASSFEKEGDYEKALKIYLMIEKENHSNDNLLKIANLYLKAGFLHKAKYIVERVLKTSPRNVKALKELILINEKLGEVKENIEILEIFEELGIFLEKEKANAMIRFFLINGCNIKFCEGSKDFDDIYKLYPFVRREYLNYLFKTNPQKAYDLVNPIDEVDLFFYRNDIPKSKKFCNILAAKKQLKCNEKAPFEIEALKYLPDNLAELEFEYVCSNCKKIFPIYSSRCVKCNELFTQKLLLKLTSKKDIENIQF